MRRSLCLYKAAVTIPTHSDITPHSFSTLFGVDARVGHKHGGKTLFDV